MWTYSTSLYPPENDDFWQRYARGNSADHHGTDRILAFAHCLDTNQHHKEVMGFDFRHFTGWHIHKFVGDFHIPHIFQNTSDIFAGQPESSVCGV